MLTHDLDPARLAQRIGSGWPVLLALILLGGLAGLGLSYLLPPQYEAMAALGVGIDYGRTLPLSADAQRHAFDRAREVVLSDETLLEALQQASPPGSAPPNPAQVAELRQHLLLTERAGRWELRVIDGSPERAAALANAWADRARSALDLASQHALRSAEAQTQLFETGCTWVADAGPGGIAAWLCADAAPGFKPEPLAEEIQAEATLSRGVLPAMSFSRLQQAVPPLEPIYWTRGRVALAGTLAGVILGLAVAALRPGRE